MKKIKMWKLVNSNGLFYLSETPGILGGNRRGKIYGLLNCRSALSAISRGGYIKHRVFFLNERDAISAGYRPCAICMPSQYVLWKNTDYKSNGMNVKLSEHKLKLVDN